MSKITDAIEVAKRWAADPAHGYDQTHRWGPDYDCSSFLISVWEEVGVGVKGYGATWTGNMRSAFLKAGFVDVTAACELNMGAGLEAGDILLNESYHTEMYLGDGTLVGAASNEFGGITGGQSGDQTGGEIRIRPWYRYSHGWDCVLRYAGEDVSKTETTTPTTPPEPLVTDTNVGGNTYVIRQGDSWWRIADQQLGDGLLWEALMRLNGYESPDDPIYPGQIIRLWNDDCPTCHISAESEPLADEDASVKALKEYLEVEVKKLGGRIVWN